MGLDRKAWIMTFRPMPLLSVLTQISLGILLMLGHWQYDRYATKKANPTLYEAVQESGTIQVEIDGSNPANAQLVYGFADSEPIWRRYVQMSRARFAQETSEQTAKVQARDRLAACKLCCQLLPKRR